MAIYAWEKSMYFVSKEAQILPWQNLDCCVSPSCDVFQVLEELLLRHHFLYDLYLPVSETLASLLVSALTMESQKEPAISQDQQPKTWLLFPWQLWPDLAVQISDK